MQQKHKQKKKRRYIFTSLIVISLCVICVYLLFQISKLRSFQFFGTLVDRVDTTEKVVALTFDDAPTEYTDEVLQTLADKNVKTTFFAIGQALEEFPETGKAIVDAGHEIANHSYSHQRFLLKSQEFIEYELKTTDKLIRETGYKDEIYFRPPNGKKLFGLPWYLSRNNITTIMWDVEPDTYNTKTGKAGADFIVTYTIEHTRPGSIILLHPFCKNCSSDREALPAIIDELRSRGYSFVTVAELLQYNTK